MNVIELAQKVQKNNIKKVGNMHEQRIALVIKETLAFIKQEIDNAENDPVRIPILGKFKPFLIEKEENGTKIVNKRIIFKPNTKI